MREIFYDYKNSFISLNDVFEGNKGIENIWLKIYADKLPDNHYWEKFFAYNMLRNIEIYMGDGDGDGDGLKIFNTNGIIIKSKIDVFHKDYQTINNGYVYKNDDLINLSEKSSVYYIPLFLSNPIPNNLMDVRLTIELNDYFSDKIKIGVLVNEFSCNNWKNYKEYKIDQMEIIKLDNNYDNIYHKIQSNGFIEYLLFYIDEGNKIKDLQIKFNGMIDNYTFDDLNLLLPYHYLGYQIPKNYMLLPLSNKNNSGCAFSKIELIEIKINLKKNVGGNIYIMSLDKNIIHVINGLVNLKFDNSLLFEKYDWTCFNSYNNSYNNNDTYELINTEDKILISI